MSNSRCFALSIGLLALAASAQAAPPSHEHEHHGPAVDASAQASKPIGQRFATDEHLRKGMAEVHSALDDLAHYEMGHMPANMAAERAGKIEEAVNGIIANCKLAPEADAALHHIILPLQSAAQRLKKDPADIAAVSAMREAVAGYPGQFDDPSWPTGRTN